MAHPYSQSNTASQTDEGNAVIDHQMLTSAFTVDNGSMVFAILEKRPDLIRVILGAGRTLRTFFPTELYHLSVYRDPEYPAEWRVVINVSTPQEVDDAMQRLDAFEQTWLPTLSIEARELLLVTLTFL